MIISSKKSFPRTAVLDMHIAVWTTCLNFWQKKDLSISPVFAKWMFPKNFLPQIFPPVVVNAGSKTLRKFKAKSCIFFFYLIYFFWIFFFKKIFLGLLFWTCRLQFVPLNLHFRQKELFRSNSKFFQVNTKLEKKHFTLNCTSDRLNQVLKELLKRNDRIGKKDRSNYGNISKQKILAKKLILKGAPLDI